MGTRITGIIRDPKDTLEILQLMAGTEYRAEMSAMVQQEGLVGSGWRDDNRLQVREQKKVDVEEIQALREGENITLFRGQVIRASSLYISDADKFSREAVHLTASSRCRHRTRRVCWRRCPRVCGADMCVKRGLSK